MPAKSKKIRMLLPNNNPNPVEEIHSYAALPNIKYINDGLGLWQFYPCFN